MILQNTAVTTAAEVAVTRVDEYEKQKVTAAIKRHFELLKLGEIIKPNMRVLLKPNLLMKRRPEEITTTHPLIIGAIAKCLHDTGVTAIVLADSPGGPYSKSALKGIYDTCGMTDICKEYNIILNDDFTSYVQKCENGKMVKEFTLITPVKQADFIIDVARLKTHAMTTLSGGVKNLFGTIPGLMKPEFHWRFPELPDFCEMLLDLCEVVAPNVTFVDAITAMEGDGPSGGTPKSTNMIISSKSPYCTDLALCKVMSLSPSEVLTVKGAIERGVSPKSFDELEIIGDELLIYNDFKMPKAKNISFDDHVPKLIQKPVYYIINKFLSARPIIKKSECVGCRKCAQSCPANVISMKSGKAHIDKSKCIKCFCCHEMCPVKAIDIKRFPLFKL